MKLCFNFLILLISFFSAYTEGKQGVTNRKVSEYLLQDAIKGKTPISKNINYSFYKKNELQIIPSWEGSFNNSGIAFPPLIVGTESWQGRIEFTNVHPDDVYYNVAIVGSSDFTISRNTCVQGVTFCLIEVEYTPTTIGKVSAQLNYSINIGAPGNPDQHFSFPVTGQGLPYVECPECSAYELGSIIKMDNRALSESVHIVGTDFSLVYSSDYAEGFIKPETEPEWIENFNPEAWSVSVVHHYDIQRGKLHLGTGKIVKRLSTLLPSGLHMIVNDDEIYLFDADGKHFETKSALTGALKYSFTYASNFRISKITDPYNNETNFLRTNGRLTSIVSPYGQVTTVTTNSSRLINRIRNPNQEEHGINYNSSDLMTGYKRPSQTQFSTIQYDNNGRLKLDQGIGGNLWNIIEDYTGDYPATVQTSNLGRTKRYSSNRNAENVFERTITKPSGFITTYSEGPDRSNVSSNAFETVSTETQSDERFGNRLPRLSKVLETKNGKTRTTEILKATGLADPADPFSYSEIITTTKINNAVTTDIFTKQSLTRTIRDPEGVITNIKINNLERPVSMQLGNDVPMTITYDERGRVSEVNQSGQNKITYTYNEQGYVETETNGLNQVTSYGYDLAGRQTSITLPDSRIIEYKYNADGKIIEITPPGKPPHVFNYNLMELLESYLPPFLSGEDVNTTYEYNLDKQLTAVNRPNGKTLNYSYHSVTGLLESMDFEPGELQSYTYIPNTEHPSVITSPDEVQSSFSYFGMEDLASETQTIGTDSIKVSFEHDNYFRPINRTIEVNSSIVGSIPTDYRLNGQPSLVGEMSLGYDTSSGRLVSTILNKVRDTRTYDQYGNLKSYRVGFYPGTKCKTIDIESCATEFYSYQLTRDTLNRIIQKDEKVQGVTAKYKYGYDTAGRLAWVTKNGATESLFNYDSNSNRISGKQNRKSFTATYDSQDRLLTYTLQGSLPKSFEYNANGELVSITEGGVVTNFTPDVLGRLKSVTLPNSSLINYKLDHEGRRAQKLINGSPVKRLVYEDTSKVAAELDPAGVIKEYVYATNINSADYMKVGTTLYRVIKDHLGSPRFVVNARTGSIVQRMDYNEWGMVTLDTNPGFQSFGFAGGIYDQDTKLVKFGARDYDGSTGRWLSKDPILFNAGDTNLYGYVLQDPVNLIDPTGKVAVAGAGAGSFIICAGTILFVADKAAEIKASKICQKNNPDETKKSCDEKASKDGFKKNVEDILND